MEEGDSIAVLSAVTVCPLAMAHEERGIAQVSKLLLLHAVSHLPHGANHQVAGTCPFHAQLQLPYQTA